MRKQRILSWSALESWMNGSLLWSKSSFENFQNHPQGWSGSLLFLLPPPSGLKDTWRPSLSQRWTTQIPLHDGRYRQPAPIKQLFFFPPQTGAAIWVIDFRGLKTGVLIKISFLTYKYYLYFSLKNLRDYSAILKTLIHNYENLLK